MVQQVKCEGPAHETQRSRPSIAPASGGPATSRTPSLPLESRVLTLPLALLALSPTLHSSNPSTRRQAAAADCTTRTHGGWRRSTTPRSGKPLQLLRIPIGDWTMGGGRRPQRRVDVPTGWCTCLGRIRIGSLDLFLVNYSYNHGTRMGGTPLPFWYVLQASSIGRQGGNGSLG